MLTNLHLLTPARQALPPLDAGWLAVAPAVVSIAAALLAARWARLVPAPQALQDRRAVPAQR